MEHGKELVFLYLPSGHILVLARARARESLYRVSRCTTVATLFFTLRIATTRVDAHLDTPRAQRYHTSEMLLKHTSGASDGHIQVDESHTYRENVGKQK